MFFELLLSYLSGSAYSSSVKEPFIPVSRHSTITVSVSIEGAVSSRDLMIFDTGSRFSWVLHYRLIKFSPLHTGGGYSISRLRTGIDIPEGGRRIQYADGDTFESSAWARKNFTIGSHSWEQSFGIVDNVEVRELPTMVTGLIGASRNSEFAQSHPIFGFVPYTPIKMGLNLEAVDAASVCHADSMVYFPLTRKSPLDNHWAITGAVSFGGMLFRGHFVLDTGASVIGLPRVLFEAFVFELLKRNIKFAYSRQLLSGRIRCSDAYKLPDWWLIRDKGSYITITKEMYVRKADQGICYLLVAELENHNPFILGLPLLGHVVSEFNAHTERAGLCRPKNSWITDYDDSISMETPEQFWNQYDKPSLVSSGSRLSANLILGFIIFITL